MRPNASERLRDLLLAAVVAALASAVVATDLGAALQRPLADALLRFAAARPPPLPQGLPDVAVVALDPQSLRAFPQWPWPRGVYAEAIARLDAAGAKVIAFDIDFSTPRDPADDARLAQAVRASGRVVLAAFRQVTPLDDGGALEVASLPLDALAAGAAAVGSVLVRVDSDGVVRTAPVVSAVGGEAMPSLAAAALAAAIGEPPPRETPHDMRIDYRRAAPGFPVLAMVDVVEGRFDPRDVAGRIVLVGATANEFQDLWTTPLGPAQPGVLIQAVAARTLIAARAGLPVVAAAPKPALAVLCAALSVAAALLAPGGSHGRRLAALVVLLAATLFGAVALALRVGTLLDPAVPSAVLGLHYVLGLESLRSRFGRHIAARELSLSTLQRVGEATTAAQPAGALEVALALLGDVLDARAVALLRASPPEGLLDGRRIEWHRREDAASGSARRAIGDDETARSVLADRALRALPARLPGRDDGLAVYAPLFASRVAVGVLVVERDDPRPLDEMELRTLATVGMQLALSAENLRLIDGLRATFDASISAIATAIEARDGYTEAHCRRLAAFSALMADRLGLAPDEIEAVRLGALLHDVGKIGIRDQILLKPGRFTAEERADMQRHPAIGIRIIERIEGLAPTTLDCVLHHHEWWNGSGYPSGLAGEAIPLGARIVSIVDVWDALSTARPYKAALAPEDVRGMIEKGRGVQFDPALVDLFWMILDEDGEALLAETRA